MEKAILICGRLCCGKSTYTEKLKKERRAAVLSCDDLMLALFPEQLGDSHEEFSKKAQGYLLERAADLLGLGVPVILEWGFWTRESRRQADAFFRGRGFETEWHYLSLDRETWRGFIEKRNREGAKNAYYVDENLIKKCEALFEPPAENEMDIVVRF